jgi:hypothetical protein
MAALVLQKADFNLIFQIVGSLNAKPAWCLQGTDCTTRVYTNSEGANYTLTCQQLTTEDEC